MQGPDGSVRVNRACGGVHDGRDGGPSHTRTPLSTAVANGQVCTDTTGASSSLCADEPTPMEGLDGSQIAHCAHDVRIHGDGALAHPRTRIPSLGGSSIGS